MCVCGLEISGELESKPHGDVWSLGLGPVLFSVVSVLILWIERLKSNIGSMGAHPRKRYPVHKWGVHPKTGFHCKIQALL